MNKWIGKGRITENPELKITASGIPSCRFNIAVDRKFKDKDGERKADFISCTAWRQTAEFICKYFNKGSMMLIDGTLQNNDYTDKDGIKHYGYVVVVENVEFCESKANQSCSETPVTAQTANSNILNCGDLSDFEEILSDSEAPF